MIGSNDWFDLNLVIFFIVASPIKNSVKTTETWILPEYTQISSPKPFFLYISLKSTVKIVVPE